MDIVRQLVAVLIALSPVLALGFLLILGRRARRDRRGWSGSRKLVVALLVGYLGLWAAALAYALLSRPGSN